MSDYIWHHATSPLDARQKLVLVLAWHETFATVIEVGDDGHPVQGSAPYSVKARELRLGRPTEGAPVGQVPW